MFDFETMIAKAGFGQVEAGVKPRGLKFQVTDSLLSSVSAPVFKSVDK